MLQKKTFRFALSVPTQHVLHASCELVLRRELRQQQRKNKPVGTTKSANASAKRLFRFHQFQSVFPCLPPPPLPTWLHSRVRKNKQASFCAVDTDATCTTRFARSFVAPRRRHSTAVVESSHRRRRAERSPRRGISPCSRWRRGTWRTSNVVRRQQGRQLLGLFEKWSSYLRNRQGHLLAVKSLTEVPIKGVVFAS